MNKKPFNPCSCPIPPDKPGFCPPKSPPPIPCMPPVPSVVEGQSLYEAVNNLTNKVNVCISTYNDVMANCYKTLHNLEAAAEENGAYYGPCEVWTEQGYDADSSATYTLIHKNVVDRRGEPIRIKLHVAYGNTTNSKISQNIFSASKITYADKMVVAQPMGTDGWYGNAIFNGAPIPSAKKENLYTVGFTRSGVMKVYNNAVTIDQMLRDTVEDAMGCAGVLIQNGQVMGDSYIENIPNYSIQTSRVCVGQNMDSREVIFLVCGNENDVNMKGMTSKACADILLQYGCDIAVELCEGTSAGATDKGSLMFVPENDIAPEAYCFWYISRSCFYKTDYERELAELMQNYGLCAWETYLQGERLKGLRDDLEAEIQNRINGDSALNDAIEKEIADRIENFNSLNSALAQEITDRQNADTALNAAIAKEIEDRQNADTALNEAISAETENRQNADSALNDAIEALQASLNTLSEKFDALQQQCAAMDAAITAVQLTITEIETSLNNIKELIEQIRSGVIVLPYVRLAGDTMTGTLNMGGNAIKSVKDPVDDQDAATKAYVDAHSGGGSYELPIASSSTLGGVKIGTGITISGDGTISASGGGGGEGYLPLDGGTMAGSINMSNNKIINIASPTETTDAVNKQYVDTAITENAYTLPTATNDTLGGVKGSSSVIVGEDGTLSATYSSVGAFPVQGGDIGGNIDFQTTSSCVNLREPIQNSDAATKQYVDNAVNDNAYTLPAATASTLGGVKVGANLQVTADGTLSATPGEQYELPVATSSTLGGVKASSSVSVETDGTMTATASSVGALPITGGTMSGVINMGGQTISNVGTPSENTDAATKQYVDQSITENAYVLPTASESVKGGIIVGKGLNIDSSANLIADVFGLAGTALTQPLYISTTGVDNYQRGTSSDQPLATWTFMKALSGRYNTNGFHYVNTDNYTYSDPITAGATYMLFETLNGNYTITFSNRLSSNNAGGLVITNNNGITINNLTVNRNSSVSIESDGPVVINNLNCVNGTIMFQANEGVTINNANFVNSYIRVNSSTQITTSDSSIPVTACLVMCQVNASIAKIDAVNSILMGGGATSYPNSVTINNNCIKNW